MSFLWSSDSNPSTDSTIKKSDEDPKDKIVKKEAVEASSQDLLTNKSELKRAAKRPIESQDEDQTIENKKSKMFRNEMKYLAP